MIPRDTLWRPAPAAAGRYHSWLIDRGSLTARVQSRCTVFRVDLLFQGRRRVDRDERFLVPANVSAVVREVCLVCNRTPVVFAHSVVAAEELRGPWRAIAGLGTRPLGAALFADHRVRRYPLRQQKLGRGHELYRRACAVLGEEPPVLWARRSVFALGNSPILVTEVFLPSILDL